MENKDIDYFSKQHKKKKNNRTLLAWEHAALGGISMTQEALLRYQIIRYYDITYFSLCCRDQVLVASQITSAFHFKIKSINIQTIISRIITNFKKTNDGFNYYYSNTFKLR